MHGCLTLSGAAAGTHSRELCLEVHVSYWFTSYKDRRAGPQRFAQNQGIHELDPEVACPAIWPCLVGLPSTGVKNKAELVTRACQANLVVSGDPD